ncbi:MAG: ABC transporter ATP-binding protein, partial [Anaerolineales bacterium]|nr:ABC transporter ATP-binding protein [Anaerolineales bacterium]
MVKHYPIKAGLLRRTVGWVKAVDDVSFDIYEGETFGLVGESGCGKTTLGRTMLQLIQPTSGEVIFQGQNVFDLHGRTLKA